MKPHEVYIIASAGLSASVRRFEASRDSAWIEPMTNQLKAFGKYIITTVANTRGKATKILLWECVQSMHSYRLFPNNGLEKSFDEPSPGAQSSPPKQRAGFATAWGCTSIQQMIHWSYPAHSLQSMRRECLLQNERILLIMINCWEVGLGWLRNYHKNIKDRLSKVSVRYFLKLRKIPYQERLRNLRFPSSRYIMLFKIVGGKVKAEEGTAQGIKLKSDHKTLRLLKRQTANRLARKNFLPAYVCNNWNSLPVKKSWEVLAGLSIWYRVRHQMKW